MNKSGFLCSVFFRIFADVKSVDLFGFFVISLLKTYKDV